MSVQTTVDGGRFYSTTTNAEADSVTSFVVAGSSAYLQSFIHPPAYTTQVCPISTAWHTYFHMLPTRSVVSFAANKLSVSVACLAVGDEQEKKCISKQKTKKRNKN